MTFMGKARLWEGSITEKSRRRVIWARTLVVESYVEGLVQPFRSRE